ncbi:glycosyl transferase family 90 [Reinekea thalattae]|uniref:Glycosyltransferase n=1 Tax=Reinekea thalattae TaxID=2593301 RepID=A0A5C8Z7R3_9GAMM|nr:glycosyl transferase family 90 [Reinekea thalattae]TXR53354.1 glycosyltransferase [Reinekea thalattae]
MLNLERPSFFLRKAMLTQLAKATPYSITERQIANFENQLNVEQKNRLDYYLKDRKSSPDRLQLNKAVADFKLEKNSLQYFDLAPLLHHFPKHNKFNVLYGDITLVPENPTFVKSRPISKNNWQSVLLKISTLRHFSFHADKKTWYQKADSAIWRGHAHNENRRKLVANYINNPLIDAHQTNKDYPSLPPKKPFMSVQNQLDHKFIISIEGNDVATNLKWAMASNSLVISPKLKYETWFMEGKLNAGEHYIEVADDFSDLEDKVEYYLSHPKEAEEVIEHAHRHVQPFFDHKAEKLLNLLIIKNYFERYMS